MQKWSVTFRTWKFKPEPNRYQSAAFDAHTGRGIVNNGVLQGGNGRILAFINEVASGVTRWLGRTIRSSFLVSM